MVSHCLAFLLFALGQFSWKVVLGSDVFIGKEFKNVAKLYVNEPGLKC